MHAPLKQNTVVTQANTTRTTFSFSNLYERLKHYFLSVEVDTLKHQLELHEKRIAQLCIERQKIKNELRQLQNQKTAFDDQNIVSLPSAFADIGT